MMMIITIIIIIIRASQSKPHTTEFYAFLGMLCIIIRPLAKVHM